ncbi:MAG: asparaginase [Candidatus Thermochlorobacter sp.]
MRHKAKKRIYIAYTGGTIGMKQTQKGYAPEKGFLEEQLRALSLFARPELPEITIHEYEPLLDSANMTPREWVTIARDIEAHYDDYDGFIILHGTDTMAYTASALSFMLENLGKSVILTGSQLPLMELRSDARENLIGALFLAANFQIPEVGVYFNGKLLRGNRAVKVSASGFSAFESPNYPPLASAGVKITLNWKNILPKPKSKFKVKPLEPVRIGVMTLFPGISPEVVQNFLRAPIEGLVLKTFGVGNAPDNPDLIEVFREATQRGVYIVNVSQCLEGRVDMQSYVGGYRLKEAGVLSGYDMTTEATLAKLFYLLGNSSLTSQRIRRQIEQNLRGELTR